jgi:hypothetical protein
MCLLYHVRAPAIKRRQLSTEKAFPFSRYPLKKFVNPFPQLFPRGAGALVGKEAAFPWLGGCPSPRRRPLYGTVYGMAAAAHYPALPVILYR